MAEDILQAIALIQQGRKAEAQRILLALLKSDLHNEEAWQWLVETFPDDSQRTRALEQWLKANPASEKARQGLERLKANPATPPPAKPQDKPAPVAAEPSIPPAPAVSAPSPLPATPAQKSKSPSLKKSRRPMSAPEIILLVILIVLIPSAIGFLGWILTHPQASSPQATATIATATRSLPTSTEFPTISPTGTATPTGTVPSGPGLLYFSGENECTIRWVSALGGDSLPVGSIPADLCLNDTDHWAIKRWSPDGSLFAMARIDASQGLSPAAYSIQIMRFDGTPLYQLISGSGLIPPAGLSWSPDGKRLAYVVTQETDSGSEIFVLKVVPVEGRELGEGEAIQLTGEPISLDDMTLPGQHIAWSPDGQSLALTAVDDTSQNGLYLARSIENAFSQFAGGLPMNVNVTWSPDGSLIAYNDGLAWKVITEGGDQRTVVSADSTKDVFCFAWSPDSTELICTVRVPGGAQQLMAFRVDGSSEARLLLEDAPLFAQEASNAQWLPGGTLLALRDFEDYGLYVFEAENTTLVQLGVETQGDFVWATPEGQTAAIPSPTTEAGATHYVLLDSFPVGQGPLTSVAFVPYGGLLAVGSQDGSVYMIDTNSHEVVDQYQQSSPVLALAFSWNNPILAVAYQDSNVRLWDNINNAVLFTLPGNGSPVRSVSFHLVNDHLVTGSEDGTLRLWEAQTGDLLNTLAKPGETITAVACMPNAGYVAAGGTSLFLWADYDNLEPSTFSPAGQVSAIVFNSLYEDADMMFSGGVALESWNLSTSERIHLFEGHTGPVLALSYNPDPANPLLASGSEDKTVRLWNPQTGELQQTLECHTEAVRGVAFANPETDGKIIASVGDDGMVCIWGEQP